MRTLEDSLPQISNPGKLCTSQHGPTEARLFVELPGAICVPLDGRLARLTGQSIARSDSGDGYDSDRDRDRMARSTGLRTSASGEEDVTRAQ